MQQPPSRRDAANTHSAAAAALRLPAPAHAADRPRHPLSALRAAPRRRRRKHAAAQQRASSEQAGWCACDDDAADSTVVAAARRGGGARAPLLCVCVCGRKLLPCARAHHTRRRPGTLIGTNDTAATFSAFPRSSHTHLHNYSIYGRHVATSFVAPKPSRSSRAAFSAASTVFSSQTLIACIAANHSSSTV